METLQEFWELIAKYRIEHPEMEDEISINQTNEEFGILVLATNNWQDWISQCRWVVIEKLIKDGYLIELDGSRILPRTDAWDVKRESTNRI